MKLRKLANSSCAMLVNPWPPESLDVDMDDQAAIEYRTYLEGLQLPMNAIIESLPSVGA